MSESTAWIVDFLGEKKDGIRGLRGRHSRAGKMCRACGGADAVLCREADCRVLPDPADWAPHTHTRGEAITKPSEEHLRLLGGRAPPPSCAMTGVAALYAVVVFQ